MPIPFVQIHNAEQDDDITVMDYNAIFPSEQTVVSSYGFLENNEMWPGPIDSHGSVILRRDDKCEISAVVTKEKFELSGDITGAMTSGSWIERISIKYSVDDHQFEWGADDICDGVKSGDESKFLFLTGVQYVRNHNIGGILGVLSNVYSASDSYFVDHFEIRDMHGKTYEELKELYEGRVDVDDVVAVVDPLETPVESRIRDMRIKISELAVHPTYFPPSERLLKLQSGDTGASLD